MLRDFQTDCEVVSLGDYGKLFKGNIYGDKAVFGNYEQIMVNPWTVYS